MFFAVFTCFSPYLGIGRQGGGSPKGLVHDLHMQFFTLGSSTLLGIGRGGGGGGRGSPKGLVHNLPMQFFIPGSSKIEVSETYFLDTVVT